ncbi:T6SS phospholipase effector Tle1-like catalytic domain-containing protein [Variovorax sp. RB2P76]|uniref:T6SS phospholipase effector Tle1-like catalytic domain-containing protein n=1 Tax=Variovorax sp. RB2P76 TaxID=3443736 RepID=UPI003F44F353
MSVQFMPLALPGDRRLSLKEKVQRAAAINCIERSDKAALCASMIHVGIFFDGTNNNRKRDQLDVLGKEPKDKDFSRCSHSNVVVLHDAFREDPKNGYYRIYVPGVGTPFEEIGEKTETPDGKAKATGGDARINWALIQLLNAMHQAIHVDELLVDDAEAGRLATKQPLHVASTGPNMPGKRVYFVGRATGLHAEPGGKLGELKKALQSKPPKKLVQVNLSVFGFSRGAAQARAFCHFLHHLLLKEKSGSYTLADVPFRVQFLGLFDSVASVGLADSSPFWRGLGGWANGTLDIVPSVERTVHLCAAHEIRINFPLSTGRQRDNKYPPNCVEKVYPGAHSNVGGGYDPGCQGKAVGARAKLLSQMPLLDMYHEARNSAVPLLSIEKLKALGAAGAAVANDLAIDGEGADLFNAYREWSIRSGVGGSIEAAQHGHMQLYWRWRLMHMNDVPKLPSYQRASEQDRIDMRESDADFASDVAAALGQKRLESDLAQTEPLSLGNSGLSTAQKDFLRIYEEFSVNAPASKVPAAANRFFDEMVHDSHASFYMVGPVTAFDREEKIKQIQNKVEITRRHMAWVKDTSATLILPPGAVRRTPPPMDEARSLSELERRIWDHQKTHPGEFPQLTDADREQLLAMEDVVTSGAVRLVTNKTRRELGGHLRYRRVFDRS